MAERTSPKICEDPRFDNALFGVAHESPRDARLSTLSPLQSASTDSSTHLQNQLSLSILSILCVYIYVRIRSIDFVEGLVSRRDSYGPIVLVSSRTIIRIPELLLRNVTAVVLFHVTHINNSVYTRSFRVSEIIVVRLSRNIQRYSAPFGFNVAGDQTASRLLYS